MRREGGFTNKDAARLWIKTDPVGSAGIVSRHDEDGPVIKENRLSELMTMQNGRMPDGLVKAFLDLWARRPERSSGEVRALADEITVVYKNVREESRNFATSAGVRNRRDAKVVHLTDTLLSVQHQLVEATQNENRFRSLVFVLVVALNQLQHQYDHLTRERDELLERAQAAEVAALASQQAEIASNQLLRARSQLGETEDRLTEATALVKNLQHQYAQLLAWLNDLGSPATPSPSAGSSTDVPALGAWSSGSLRDHERVLDRIDQELQEGTQRLEQTRREVARNVEPHTDEPTVHGQVLRPDAEVPENSPLETPPPHQAPTSPADQAAVAQELAANFDLLGGNLTDHVIQRLFATGMSLQGTVRRITDPTVRRRVSRAVEQLDETVREIRTSIFASHTTEIDGVRSLRRRMLDIVDELSAGGGVTPSVRISGSVDVLVPEALAVHAAAVLREAVSNAVRHSHAGSIVVTVEASSDLIIDVVDDGVGMPPGVARSGLLGVERRAAKCGGMSVVVPGPEGGTRLTWRAPLPPSESSVLQLA
jgi:signal transduction histidine kinase